MKIKANETLVKTYALGRHRVILCFRHNERRRFKPIEANFRLPDSGARGTIDVLESKGCYRRIVRIRPCLQVALQQLWDMADSGDPSQLIVPAMSTHRLQSIKHVLVKQCGGEAISLQDLRRAFASHALAECSSETDLAAEIGWSIRGTRRNFYTTQPLDSQRYFSWKLPQTTASKE